MHPRYLVSTALLFLATACNSTGSTPVAHDPERERGEIEALMATLVQLGEAKNSAASAALHTQDALLLPPGGGLVEGRTAIEEFMAVPSTATISDTTIETLRLDVEGDLAYHAGRYEFSLTDAGATEIVRGRFVMVWRHERAGWRVEVDIWDRE